MAIDLEVYYGDVFDKTLTIRDSDGDTVDITNDIITFTIKERDTDDDTDIIIQKELTVLNQVSYEGQATLSLSAVETRLDVGNYMYDIEWVDYSGRTTIYNPAGATSPVIGSGLTTLTDEDVTSFISEGVEAGQSIIFSYVNGSETTTSEHNITTVTASTITFAPAVTAAFKAAFIAHDGDYDIVLEDIRTLLKGQFSVIRDVYHHD